MCLVPSVSLLIAMRNEAEHIGACLRSILSQSYPQTHLEVLILDGQSDDRSLQIVEELIQQRANFKLIENPGRIQSSAWNLGIEECHGEIISIVSGHAELSRDYVSKAVETLLRTRADMVGGTVHACSTSPTGGAIALALSTPFGIGGARFRYTDQEEETDTVFMGFCRRSVYQRIGGFDEELVHNQDDEFSYRLSKSGGRIICNPQIVSTYYSRVSLRNLWNQYYQYGYWKVRVLQKHPLQMRLRQFVPPTFVLSLIASALLTFFPVLRPLSLVIPALYLLANLLASIYTAAKHGWEHLLLLPFVFGILHMSYGLGFLIGLIKFASRWGDRRGRVPAFSS